MADRMAAEIWIGSTISNVLAEELWRLSATPVPPWNGAEASLSHALSKNCWRPTTTGISIFTTMNGPGVNLKISKSSCGNTRSPTTGKRRADTSMTRKKPSTDPASAWK